MRVIFTYFCTIFVISDHSVGPRGLTSAVDSVSKKSSLAGTLERPCSVVAFGVDRAIVTATGTLIDVDANAVVVSVVEAGVTDALGDVVFDDAVVVCVTTRLGARIVPGV